MDIRGDESVSVESGEKAMTGGVEYIDHPDLGLIIRVDDPSGETSVEDLRPADAGQPLSASCVEVPQYEPRGWVHIRIDDGEEWSCMDGTPCPSKYTGPMTPPSQVVVVEKPDHAS